MLTDVDYGVVGVKTFNSHGLLAFVCTNAVSFFLFFVCLGNADVEVYRRLNGVTGEVVEPFNIYSDDIG